MKLRLIAALRATEPKLNARAGKKEEGWGRGIPCRGTGQAFARPRFRHFFFRHRRILCQ